MEDRTKAILYGGAALAALSTLVVLSQPKDAPKLGRANGESLWRIKLSPKAAREQQLMSFTRRWVVTAAVHEALENDPPTESIGEANTFILYAPKDMQITYKVDVKNKEALIISVIDLSLG